MIPSTLFFLVVALSSLAAVNSAVIQRDGTFTFLTPQPTATSTTTTPTATSTTATTTGTVTSPTTTGTVTSPTTTGTVTSPTTTGTVTSPTTTATTPAPTSTGAGTSNCNGVQQWLASFAYSAGDRAIFNGQLFTARQWTYNNAPPAHADQWKAEGTCAQPINNQGNCNGVSAWSSTVAYTTGNRVTFNNHVWSAVQWSQSNNPGDTSGSWKDQGAC